MVDTWVDVGLPGGADGLEFVALEPGGEVPLQTFGQGGTHALLAVRCGGLGNAAFVGVEIANGATGDTVSAPPSASPVWPGCCSAPPTSPRRESFSRAKMVPARANTSCL